MIPVSELKVINDVISRGHNKQTAIEEGLDHKGEEKPQLQFFNIADPEATPSSDIVNKLEEINQTLITLTKVINKFNK